MLPKNNIFYNTIYWRYYDVIILSILEQYSKGIDTSPHRTNINQELVSIQMNNMASTIDSYEIHTNNYNCMKILAVAWDKQTNIL